MFALLIWVAAGLGVARAGNQTPSASQTNALPGYVGPESCKGCHSVEYSRWAKSPHGLAERSLRPEVDRVAFDPSHAIHSGSQTSVVRVLKGQHQIVTAGFQTNSEAYRVERVIGSGPVEQFLTAIGNGRWQVHEISHDPKRNQWFDVYGNENRQPGEWGHWTGRGMNWNSRCASCHNTRVKKNYDEATDSYDTTMAEMSIGCEACHGPLKAHVEWRKAYPDTKMAELTFPKLSPAQILDMCGSCHSRQEDLTGEFTPGESFFDHYSLEILDYSQQWYPDGQVKDEDYEFVSFLSSKMYQAGVTCLDCHPRDVRKTPLQGNALCMSCHNGSRPKAPVIDPAAHGHHKLDDKGGECAGCHLPVTVFMQRSPRHDHGMTIPDPLLTKELGIPNACTRCHEDKSVDWAIEFTDKWYGPKMNRHTRDRARWIAAAQRGDIAVKDRLIGVLKDEAEPAYWRAVAANFLGQWAVQAGVKAALLGALKDGHPLVRENAVIAIETLVDSGDAESKAALKPMLEDSSRNVRVAAAWALRAIVDLQSRTGRELQRWMDLDADQPTGQYRKAMFELARQHPTQAVLHLRKAVEWDTYSPPFRCKLAEELSKVGKLSEALAVLDRGETLVSGDPHIPYVRAEILLRNGRSTEARAAAIRALEIEPDFQPAKRLLQKLSTGR